MRLVLRMRGGALLKAEQLGFGAQQLSLIGAKREVLEPGKRGGTFYRTDVGNVKYGQRPQGRSPAPAKEQEPFSLTAWEPPAEKARPFEISEDGGKTWKPMQEGELHKWLAHYADSPDAKRSEVDQGHTVAVQVQGSGRKVLFRKTPTKGQREDAKRQMGLFG